MTITDRGTVELSGGWIGALFASSMAILLIFAVLAYNAGYFAGGKVIRETEQKCTLGSAVVSNHPETLSCWDSDKEAVYVNLTNEASNLDLSNGYLTIRADEGCLQMITVTAKTGNSTALTVRQASPSKDFMAADYEDWPTPPKFLAEDASVTFEYYITLNTPQGWANGTVQNFTVHIDIPEAGEPMAGCNRDVGDGVCEWNSRIWIKNLEFNESTGPPSHAGNSWVERNATCSANETGAIKAQI